MFIIIQCLNTSSQNTLLGDMSLSQNLQSQLNTSYGIKLDNMLLISQKYLTNLIPVAITLAISCLVLTLFSIFAKSNALLGFALTSILMSFGLFFVIISNSKVTQNINQALFINYMDYLYSTLNILQFDMNNKNQNSPIATEETEKIINKLSEDQPIMFDEKSITEFYKKLNLLSNNIEIKSANIIKENFLKTMGTDYKEFNSTINMINSVLSTLNKTASEDLTTVIKDTAKVYNDYIDIFSSISENVTTANQKELISFVQTVVKDVETFPEYITTLQQTIENQRIFTESLVDKFSGIFTQADVTSIISLKKLLNSCLDIKNENLARNLEAFFTNVREDLSSVKYTDLNKVEIFLVFNSVCKYLLSNSLNLNETIKIEQFIGNIMRDPIITKWKNAQDLIKNFWGQEIDESKIITDLVSIDQVMNNLGYKSENLGTWINKFLEAKKIDQTKVVNIIESLKTAFAISENSPYGDMAAILKSNNISSLENIKKTIDSIVINKENLYNIETKFLNEFNLTHISELESYLLNLLNEMQNNFTNIEKLNDFLIKIHLNLQVSIDTKNNLINILKRIYPNQDIEKNITNIDKNLQTLADNFNISLSDVSFTQLISIYEKYLSENEELNKCLDILSQINQAPVSIDEMISILTSLYSLANKYDMLALSNCDKMSDLTKNLSDIVSYQALLENMYVFFQVNTLNDLKLKIDDIKKGLQIMNDKILSKNENANVIYNEFIANKTLVQETVSKLAPLGVSEENLSSIISLLKNKISFVNNNISETTNYIYSQRDVSTEPALQKFKQMCMDIEINQFYASIYKIQQVIGSSPKDFFKNIHDSFEFTKTKINTLTTSCVNTMKDLEGFKNEFNKMAKENIDTPYNIYKYDSKILSNLETLKDTLSKYVFYGVPVKIQHYNDIFLVLFNLNQELNSCDSLLSLKNKNFINDVKILTEPFSNTNIIRFNKTLFTYNVNDANTLLNDYSAFKTESKIDDIYTYLNSGIMDLTEAKNIISLSSLSALNSADNIAFLNNIKEIKKNLDDFVSGYIAANTSSSKYFSNSMTFMKYINTASKSLNDFYNITLNNLKVNDFFQGGMGMHSSNKLLNNLFIINNFLDKYTLVDEFIMEIRKAATSLTLKDETNETTLNLQVLPEGKSVKNIFQKDIGAGSSIVYFFEALSNAPLNNFMYSKLINKSLCTHENNYIFSNMADSLISNIAYYTDIINKDNLNNADLINFNINSNNTLSKFFIKKFSDLKDKYLNVIKLNVLANTDASSAYSLSEANKTNDSMTQVGINEKTLTENFFTFLTNINNFIFDPNGNMGAYLYANLNNNVWSFAGEDYTKSVIKNADQSMSILTTSANKEINATSFLNGTIVSYIKSATGITLSNPGMITDIIEPNQTTPILKTPILLESGMSIINAGDYSFGIYLVGNNELNIMENGFINITDRNNSRSAAFDIKTPIFITQNFAGEYFVLKPQGVMNDNQTIMHITHSPSGALAESGNINLKGFFDIVVLPNLPGENLNILVKLTVEGEFFALKNVQIGDSIVFDAASSTLKRNENVVNYVPGTKTLNF
jgi:hypothetical protein